MSTTPHIFAHRGANRLAPENSLAAIREAIALGADGVELDVHLSRDKVPVLFHNTGLGELTTTYRFIYQAPLRALQSLRLRHDTQDSDESIPTLAAALETLRPSSLRINLELKGQPYWHLGLEQRVIALVKDMGLEERVVISSFSPFVLLRARHYGPLTARGLLVHPRAFCFPLSMLTARVVQARSVHVAVSHLGSRLPRMVTERGYKLWVWTANDAAQVDKACALGAEAIITDEPDRVGEIVRTAHELR